MRTTLAIKILHAEIAAELGVEMIQTPIYINRTKLNGYDVAKHEAHIFLSYKNPASIEEITHSMLCIYLKRNKFVCANTRGLSKDIAFRVIKRCNEFVKKLGFQKFITPNFV